MGYRETVVRVGAMHDYDRGFNGDLTPYRVKRFKESIRGFGNDRAIEIGPGTGPITRFLKESFKQVTVVEPTERYCHILREKVGGIEIVNGFFEDYRGEKADVIIASGVLEHVEDVSAFLENVKNHMKDGGMFALTVPNSTSLHRQIGMAMGIIKTLDELGPQDRAVGHYRYYNMTTLRQDLEASGLEILRMGGIFLKPLPSDEMGWLPKDRYYDALDYVGRALPNLCAEIFCMARKGVTQ